MSLPASLQRKLEEALGTADKMLIKSERHRLTYAYRDPEASQRSKQKIENNFQRLSYLATRVPATYAVCDDVFSRLAAYDISINTLLDLGSGPGTAAICAKYIFPEIEAITCIDQDKAFKVFAESFLSAPYFQKTKIRYALHNLADVKTFPKTDLITISYALNELENDIAQSVVHKAWQSTKQALVIIEPGTPRAFERLKQRREELISYGATILAPCPHDGDCPMADGDWCHFSVRVERSALHKYIKDADLNYEDEKFSYLIAVKSMAIERPSNRIVKNPQKRSGHQIFDLCTPNGLQSRTVSKSDKLLYKIARKKAWGDVLEITDNDSNQ